MIKWDPEKGWYDTNTGVGLNSPEEEARTKKYLEDRNKFLQENMYDPSRDYSDDFGGLFGADVDESAELYYAGPQSRWQGALDDRLRERASQKENIYGGSGYYEGSTGTMDRDLQRQMYRRNNAIEDMFRKGYSTTQIQAHVEGKRNVIEEGPDYKDYEKAKAGEKVFNVKGREGWAEDYFDVPEYQTQTGTQDGGADAGQTDTGQTDTGQTGGGPGDQTIAPQPPPAGLPGKGGASGSGKGGAQTPQQTQPPQQSSPFQPQQSQRRSMYSSSPAGLGTGYYGGMGSGRRQFGGGGSYFGGFGGQQSQPSYYGGYSQPYQQSYQQPSYGGYSSYGGYGGSMGGIGGFYQPMRYGGYR